jgi:hypothetical protein
MANSKLFLKNNPNKDSSLNFTKRNPETVYTKHVLADRILLQFSTSTASK